MKKIKLKDYLAKLLLAKKLQSDDIPTRLLANRETISDLVFEITGNRNVDGCTNIAHLDVIISDKCTYGEIVLF